MQGNKCTVGWHNTELEILLFQVLYLQFFTGECKLQWINYFISIILCNWNIRIATAAVTHSQDKIHAIPIVITSQSNDCDSFNNFTVNYYRRLFIEESKNQLILDLCK